MRLRTRIVFASLCSVLLWATTAGDAVAFGGCLFDWLHLNPNCHHDDLSPCVFYAVQDTGLNESEFLRVDLRDPNTGAELLRITELGSCAECDVEAIALDLSTGRLYGIAGGDGTSSAPLPEAGDLFEIDRESGDMTVIGSTGAVGAAEIVAASFRPGDDTLWAFQETVGLVTVDLTDASTTVELQVAGLTDQEGDPVGDNWEGIAWNAAGTVVYGAQGNVLYRWDPVQGDVQRVCSNLAPAGGMVEALEFSTDGRLTGARHLQQDRTLIEIDFPSDESEFGDAACTVTPVQLPSGPLVDDIESLAFESCDTVPFACDTALPRALVFEYTGESCAATNNTQQGQLFCWGNPHGAQPVRVDVLYGAGVSPSSQTITVGSQFTITATGNHLPNWTWITIHKGWNKLQKLVINTSCSQRLEVGDQFGSLVLREYIPAN